MSSVEFNNIPRKKRILWIGEASYLMSGFGTYANEVLTRLHATGKYELAEFATYGLVNDARDKNVKWKFYANAVKDDDERNTKYKADPINQFGLWRLDRVLLDYKPDIVIAYRDPWMDSYILDSPLRRFFHFVWMPSVDSAPQKEEWLEQFARADGILTYSEWNMKVLKQEGGGKIKTHRPASPGINLDIFCPPANLQQHRRDMHFMEDVNIIGTVMRNQRRKLYPDLFLAFKRYLEICHKNNQHDLAKKTYLYIHTSYPDVGWNFPQLLKETGLGHKIIFTYICRNCKKPFCAFFQDARTVCPACNSVAGIMPSVSEGLSTPQLANVYKLFDLYIQYATNEGFGMVMVEAAACGVPVMAVDYSAMEDVVRNTKGIPLKVQRMFREVETHALRALPDNEYCAQQLYLFFNKSSTEIKQLRKKVREATKQHYNWDYTADIWEKYIDAIELKNTQGKWDETPPYLHKPAKVLPENLSNIQFVEWLIKDVWGRPDKLNSYLAFKLLRDINHGVINVGSKIQKLDRTKLIQGLTNKAEHAYTCEKGRCGLIPLIQEDYLEYARIKEKMNVQN